VVFFESTPHTRFRWVQALVLLSALVLSTGALAQQNLAQQNLAQQTATHKHPAKPAKKAVPDPPPAPAPPPPPPTLEQMPAQPPQVHYSQGKLTILAENSTLGDILRAVRAQTGAVIETPPNATERVVAHFGPGPARDVLTALLNGSHFNYVMIGSPLHPESVERLILTSKSSGVPEGAPTMTATPSNDQAQMDEQAPQQIDVAEQPVDDPPENSAVETPQPNAQPMKTPEQMLHELQQQQQQLQQQQQQQQGQQGPPGPPPQGAPN
jgi:hypothetical protein